jgi:alanyl-tRNA synthetase
MKKGYTSPFIVFAFESPASWIAMKTDEIREKYLEFFQSKGHTRKSSDVLVPTWDPSVLFTPAGMNQFKDHFLGKVKLEFTRATTCQKCLRTGDIDNVGRTAYHHTFFEMLGNFSFGDYFKRDAIHWAWEFLTEKKWMGLDPARLSVTVYLDDDEAADIWHSEVGLPTSRIERLGEDENFWPASAPSQGPDGVCGPCSEIYVQRDIGKPVEIWNLVFTQFNRVGEPPNNLRPLPSKNIDTGMGLERMASVMQGVETNYHIDLLRPLVEAAAEVCGVHYDPASDHGRRLRRIADHLRACVFAVHEHVVPGANKQKYVIRRLLRRAVLDGHQLGLREPFLYQLVGNVAAAMKSPYPELSDTVQRVANTIRAEEENFLSTLDAGLARIEKVFSDMSSQGRKLVSGREGAELYQTYGVPPELVENLAIDRGYTFDWPQFRGEMEKHGATSGKIADVVFKTGPVEALKKTLLQTTFVGYDMPTSSAEIKGIVATLGDEERLCDTLACGETSEWVKLVLDQTPFYGESGGQVGDSGEIVGRDFRFVVSDTQKDADLIIHLGKLVEGKLTAGAECETRVDTARRNAIRRAHSATHMLHAALQKTLGQHAQQQGSKVDADWLRFDFSNQAPVNEEQLATIEADVLAHVASHDPIGWKLVPLAEARSAGAMMLFGEKYPDPVRMVSMGSFSRELCGGTHLDNTGDVEAFELISEEGVSAGTRRLVALTGEKAREFTAHTMSAVQQAATLLKCSPHELPVASRVAMQRVRDLKKALASGAAGEETPSPASQASVAPTSAAVAKHLLRETARLLNVAPFDVPARVQALLDEAKALQEQLAALASSGSLSADTLLDQATDVSGAKFIVASTPHANPNLMRQWIDQIRQKTGSSAVLLIAAQGPDKVTLVAGLSRDLVAKGYSAGDWVKEVAPIVGGGGGGKPDLAQAGGKDPSRIDEALAQGRVVGLRMLQA